MNKLLLALCIIESAVIAFLVTSIYFSPTPEYEKSKSHDWPKISLDSIFMDSLVLTAAKFSGSMNDSNVLAYFDDQQKIYEYGAMFTDPIRVSNMVIIPSISRGLCVSSIASKDSSKYVKVKVSLNGDRLNIDQFILNKTEYAQHRCFKERPKTLTMIGYIPFNYRDSTIDFSVKFFSPNVSENPYELTIELFNWKNRSLLYKTYSDKGTLPTTSSVKSLSDKLWLDPKFVIRQSVPPLASNK